MYNITDNSYSKVDIPAGQAAPPRSAHVNAIHAIFQKIHQPQFKLPDNHKSDPIGVQAQLKREALQAVRDDLNNHWGITKFFIFLLRLTPFKLEIEKKADQILRDTGKLSLKAKDLGHKAGKAKDFVEALNAAWLSRKAAPEVMSDLPDGVGALYRDPHASLEEFIKAVDDSGPYDRLQIRQALIGALDPSSPLAAFLDHKTETIDRLKKIAFELREEDIPEFNLDEDIPSQIKNLKDEELKRLLFGLPEDDAYPLHQEALKALSIRIKSLDDNPDSFLIPPGLALSDAEKGTIAKRLLAIYSKFGSKDFPAELIKKLDLVNDDSIKSLKYKVEAFKAKSSHKLDDSALKLFDKVPVDKQKELMAFAENNDTAALNLALRALKDDDKLNFTEILSALLKKKLTNSSREAVVALFERIDEGEREKAFLLLSRSKLVPDLLSGNTLALLPKNEEGKVNFAYLAAFKKLIDESPKGIKNTSLIKPLFLKLTSEERIQLIEHILSKENPLLYLDANLLALADDNEPLPYEKIVDRVLTESSKETKPVLSHVYLLRIAIKRMAEEEKQNAFEKILKSDSPIAFTLLNSRDLEPLEAFQEKYVRMANFKTALLKNLKLADLLIATGSTIKLFEIFEVEDVPELLNKLAETRANYKLLKLLIAKKVIPLDLVEKNMSNFHPEVQALIKKDKYFEKLFNKEAKEAL